MRISNEFLDSLKCSKRSLALATGLSDALILRSQSARKSYKMTASTPLFCNTLHHLHHFRTATSTVSLRCAIQRPRAGATAISWNVNSLRSLIRKNPRALESLVEEYDPDVICLQETKLQEQHERLFSNLIDGFKTVIFSSSTARLGYSGTATFAKRRCQLMQRQVNHPTGDEEGRMIMLEFPGVYVVNVYTMNSGTGLKRLDTRMTWDAAFRRLIRELRKEGKPVVVLGDLNVAREERDVWDAKSVKDKAGFSDSERQSFEDMLETCGMVDAFRALYPDEQKFTFWDYRTRARRDNRGWRIDYALVSNDMVGAVADVRILDHIEGSDHCPVAIDLAPGML